MFIGYIGNFRHPFCTEVHVAASLKALGHSVFQLQEDTVNWRGVPRLARSRHFDMVLWTRTWGAPERDGHDMVSMLRDQGVPTVSFHLDRWWGLDREYQVLADAFFRTDLVVTADGGHEDHWVEEGITHRWLPPGVLHTECGPVEPDPDRFPHDVVFVGSHPYPHPTWEPYRTKALDAVAAAFDGRFHIWPVPGHPLRGHDLQVLYASAKVVVGDSCLVGGVGHYWSDRIPETLGRGGLLIHPAVDGLGDWYRDGQHLLTYPLGDVDTLVDLIGQFIESPAREDIVEAGRAVVLERDTYVHRMTTVLAWVDQLRAGQDPTPVEPPLRAVPDVVTVKERREQSGLLYIPEDLVFHEDSMQLQRGPIIMRGPAEIVPRLVSLGGGCRDCMTSKSCAVCGGAAEDVLCLGDAPIANQLRDAHHDPVMTHPLHVVRCVQCGTVQLSSRPPAEVLFGDDYPYRSSQSATMLASVAHLSEYLIHTLSLGRDSLVMEVGSNDGYLLRQYLRRGVPVMGFDPAGRAADEAKEHGVPTFVEFFDGMTPSRHDAANTADVIHANNVLAHVDNPGELIEGMAVALKPGGVMVIETPWLAPLLDAGAFDTIYHEHRFYWSAHALDTLLRSHGMSVLHVEHLDLHGGSLRVYASDRDTRSLAWEHTLYLERAAGLNGSGWAQRFETIHRGQVEQLRRWWEAVQPVAGYGAAAKATTTLHVLGVKPPLFIVDSTPAKQGKWTATDSLVLPPEELERRMPDDCVIFPWNFAGEIAAKARSYTAAGGRLWALIPHVQRVV